MINDLHYAVTFPTNGVSLSGSLSFQPGSTAISGRNGTGKSFIAEMIRYGLFGKRALRGPASDYKTLDMDLTFTIQSEEYRVVRTKKEELSHNGETLAVGADAVNKKIVELLGFELEVFDVVCAANQKESERLTRLTPAKRKELIDDVVGLTRQEAVEKACRDEAKTARTEAEALTRALVLPVEPVKPEGYRPSSDIGKELVQTRELIAQREALQRIIDAVPSEPVKPPKPCPNIAELEEHEGERIIRGANLQSLEHQLARIVEPKYTAKELDEAEALAAYDADIARRGPKPRYTNEQLDHFYDVLDAQAAAGVGAICPECQHEFHVGLTPEQEKLAAETSPLMRREIEAECAAIRNWTDPPVEPKGKRLSAADIQAGRTALALAAEKPELERERDALLKLQLDDKSAELAEARELERAWDIYDHVYEHWREAVGAAADAQAELAKLPTPKHTPEYLNNVYTEARVYEEQLASYEAAKEQFDRLSKEIAEKQERAEAFMAGAKGLVGARRTLKAFLAPSLSRVASKIISEMTVNAERPIYEIEVDEDMNITADGQDVGTFNGAHATMINLALRLALGQVLVSRVFPIFIGDELDSDADAENAQAIADALMTCTGQLKQIVLISHKRLEGVDHEVTL